MDAENSQMELKMNDLAPQSGTALALPEPTTLAAMFKAERGLDPLLAKIKADALEMVRDLNPAVKKDRDLMKSAANKVSLSKAELDRQGKALTATQRREIDVVNASRRICDEFLSDLRDSVRKAADDWEAAEAQRVEQINGAIAAIRNHGATHDDDSETIKQKAEKIVGIDIGDRFAEFKAAASEAKDNALSELRLMYSASKRREDDAAELARLRAEADARAEADRLRTAAEAEAKAEAARVAAAAEQAAAAAKAEADRAAKIEAEKAEAARIAEDRAKREAAEREAELIRLAHEAEERHRKEMADAEAKRIADIAAAKEREESAAKAERDRIAQQDREAAEAARKRAADTAHRDRILSDIAAALRTMSGAATPEAIANALLDGKIPHCRVVL